MNLVIARKNWRCFAKVKQLSAVLTFFYLVFLSNSGSAETPLLLRHQGRIVLSGTKGSAPVPMSGTIILVFRIYESYRAKSHLWKEENPVTVQNGYYSVMLGINTPLNLQIFQNYRELYLGVAIAKNQGSPGKEFTPRVRITSVPYALISRTAENVKGEMVDAKELRISGKAGIGTNTPLAKLSVISKVNEPSAFLVGTDQSGNMFTIDSSQGGGLANLVAGGYWDGKTWVYGGTRGASRILLASGEMTFFLGETTGKTGKKIPWRRALKILKDGSVNIPHRLGFGTDSPNARIEVNGAQSTGLLIRTYSNVAWAIQIKNERAKYRGLGMYQSSNGESYIWGNYPNGSKITLTPSGKVTIDKELQVTTSVYAQNFIKNSDKRLKDIIYPVKEILEKLIKLKAYYYRWKRSIPKNTSKGDQPKDRSADKKRKGNKSPKLQVGVLAQEVQKYFPQIVSRDERTGALGVDYDQLSSLILEGLRELKLEKDRQVKELKEKLEAYEEKLRRKDELLKQLAKRLKKLEGRLKNKNDKSILK